MQRRRSDEEIDEAGEDGADEAHVQIGQGSGRRSRGKLLI